MNKALALVLLLASLWPAQARAAKLPETGTLTFTLENDLFYDVDRHYTNGVRAIWVPAHAGTPPKWATRIADLVPWFPDEGVVRHGYGIGQSMFTPSDIRVADPAPGERPYAGWLYGTVGLGVQTGRQLDLFAVSIGMVGPSALAEQTQKLVHELVGADEPQGWATQIGDEPGFVATYQRSWRGLATTTLSGNQVDLSPHIGAALGNVFTYGNVGVTLRYGDRLPDDYGPPRIQPGLPGSADFAPVADFGWYLFAGVEARAVARNLFLDGNSFRDSRSVDKYPLVGDLQFGVVLDWPTLRLSYTHVLRTREFRSQTGNDDFGALGVSIKF